MCTGIESVGGIGKACAPLYLAMATCQSSSCLYKLFDCVREKKGD